MSSNSLHGNIDLVTGSGYLVTSFVELLLQLGATFRLHLHLLQEIGSFFDGGRDNAAERTNFMLNLSKIVMTTIHACSGFAGSNHHAEAADGILHLPVGFLLLLACITILL